MSITFDHTKVGNLYIMMIFCLNNVQDASFYLQNLSGMNYVSVIALLLLVIFFQVGPGM